MKKNLHCRKTRKLTLEQLQRRELMAIDMATLIQPGDLDSYSVDGTGNNTANVQWGSTNEDLLRLAKPEYGDGISTLAGADRPSPRLISNVLADQGDQDIISNRNLSAFVYAWGQFIDHDMGLTPTGTTERITVAVPTGDPYFDPASTGTKVIGTSRSVFDSATGTSTTNPRQQVNTITAWIDGSMVYGSDQKTSDALRTFVGGLLKMDAAGMLPLNNAANFPNGTVKLANDSHVVSDNQLFAAGDVRANENIELTSIQTVFVREHNRLAAKLASQNPSLTDAELYERARAIVIAEIQSITYNEWLPAILGSAGLAPYRGYNPSVNPELSNEFSTAAFRFGHSLLGNDIEFLDEQGRPVKEAIDLSDAFFNPTQLKDVSLDNIFKYLASDPSSELDSKVVGSVRNFLFGAPGQGGFDLASLNIERGRDHGLADYNDVRAAVGLPRIKTFADITKNVDTQKKLKDLYGTVDKIDLWVGALAEDHLPQASVGPTIAKIMNDQFQRLRAGDRFWYQNMFSGQLLQDINQTKLSDILKRNTSMQNLQANVFVFNSTIEGRVLDQPQTTSSVAVPSQPGTPASQPVGLPGWTVELIGSDGTTVATSQTDRAGHYQFDVQSGVRTDIYRIQVTKDPQGKSTTAKLDRSVAITRGDQHVKDIDFRIARPVTPNPPPQPPPPSTRPQPASRPQQPPPPSNRRSAPPVANPSVTSNTNSVARSDSVDVVMSHFGNDPRRRMR